MAKRRTLTKRTKWEFLVVCPYLDYPDCPFSLDALGAQGWELVSVLPEGPKDYETYFFKRVAQ